MKLSDYVINFLVERGVTHVFGMSGGAAVHLFDSAARHPEMNYVCSQHEQSAAMSADGYARVTDKMGVAITTSGPGATNLLTGTCCSFFDSIPTLMITGQVATHRLKEDRKIRQLGFQETDVLSIFQSVTKYAAQIRRAEDIRYHLEAAWHWAFEGRPGAVLLDIPDDLQRVEIDPSALRSFIHPPADDIISEAAILSIVDALAMSTRPVLVLGGGLSTPRGVADLTAFIDELGIPVLQTWAGLDLLGHDHPLRVGSFGVYAPRIGNFAIQNADFILCLGTRLSQNVTGGLLDTFARAATIAMVDAEQGELDKFDGRGIRVAIKLRAKAEQAIPRLRSAVQKTHRPDISAWLEKIAHWRKVLPDDMSCAFDGERRDVDAYRLIEALSNNVDDAEKIFVDTGGNLTWTCNAFETKPHQRLISAWNNTPMGYALPAAIGAAVAQNDPVTCIIGDGGLMICLSELATLVRYDLNVRVIVFDNKGHGIQKQTLETWLDGRFVAVDETSGLAFPQIASVCKSMGLPVCEIDVDDAIEGTLATFYGQSGPRVCVVHINPNQRLYPVLKFGAPLEDQLPALPNGFLEQEMIVPNVNLVGNRSVNGTPGV